MATASREITLPAGFKVVLPKEVKGAESSRVSEEKPNLPKGFKVVRSGFAGGGEGAFGGEGFTGEIPFAGVHPGEPGAIEAPESRIPVIATPETTKKLIEERARKRKIAGTLEDPFVDPVTAFAGGAGFMGMLTKSIAKGVLSGLTAMVAEPVIGQTAEMTSELHPGLAFPAALVLGLASGNLLEAPAERLIVKAAKGLIKKQGLPETTANIQKTINKLSPEDIVSKPGKVSIEVEGRKLTSKEITSLSEKKKMKRKLEAEAGADLPLLEERHIQKSARNRGVTLPEGFKVVDAPPKPKKPKIKVVGEGKKVKSPPKEEGVKIVRPKKPMHQQKFDPDKHSLKDFVAIHGGIDQLKEGGGGLTGELQRIREAGQGKFLVNKGTGKSLDDLRMLAVDEGFIDEFASPSEFVEALERDLTSKGLEKVFSSKRDIEVDIEKEAERMFDMEKSEMIVSETSPETSYRAPLKSQPFAGGIAAGQPLPKHAKNINLERIEASDDIKRLITDTTGQYPVAIDEAKRGKITLQETRNLANTLGMSEAQLLKRRKGQALNAEQAVRARDLLNTSAHKLREAQVKAAESGKPEDLANFRLVFERHAMIQAEVSGMTAEAGRALSSFRIKSIKKNIEVKNFKAMLDSLGGEELTQEMLDRLSKIDPRDPVSVNKFIRAAHKATTSDMIFEAWVNGLLSSPATHIVNITSNTLTGLSKLPEKATGATIDFFRAGLTRSQRGRYFGETPQAIFGAWEGMKSGTRKALWSFVNEEPFEGISKLELAGRFKSIPGKTGKVVRLPGRFLLAVDEFFKAINYESEIRSRAYRQAVKEGRRGKDRARRIGEILSDSTEELKEAGRQEALYRTFQKALGKSGKTVESFRRNTPAIRYLIPFLRTPINIAKFGLERTPLNYARIIQKVMKGEMSFTDANISDDLAKATMGSLIGATVFMLAKEGAITGAGPARSEPEKRAALFRTGWQPYSLKIGDEYFSYQRLEPLGMVFGTAADAAEIWDKSDTKKQEDIAALIVMSITQNFVNKTFMRGVSDAIQAHMDPARYGERWVHNFAGTGIPSGVAVLSRAIDPVLRKPDDLVEKMKSRLPGLSGEVLPRRNIWGETITRGEGSVAERTVSPVYRSKKKGGFIDREIVRLDLKIGLPIKKIAGVELTREQYDDYVKESGREAKSKINKYISSGKYGKLKNDFQKERFIKEVIRATRERVAGKIKKSLGKDRLKDEALKRMGFK